MQLCKDRRITMKKGFLNIIAMIFLVVPGQHLVRGLLSVFLGNDFNFSILGLSNLTVGIVSFFLILLALFLFYIAKKSN